MTDPTPAPTAPLTEASDMPTTEHGRDLVWLIGNIRERAGLPRMELAYAMDIAAIEREAIARHREQADAEVALLKAALPEDPWVWLSRRQPGHARCYACDASWSLSQGHEPDCRWVSARSVK